MTSEKPVMKDQGEPAEQRIDFGSRLAIGVSLGLIFGLMMDNLAMGLVGGMLLATLTNAYAEMKQGKKHGGTAVAISVAALIFLVVMWVVWG